MDFRFLNFEFKKALLVLSKIFIFYAEVHSKDVYFTKTDCDKYRHNLNTQTDSYQVVWNGDSYPGFCSLRFSNYEGADREWQICAEITDLQLECGGPEVSYFYSREIQRFTCRSQLPIERYCDDSIIYVKLNPYQQDQTSNYNSRLRITITRERKPDTGPSGTSDTDLSPLVYILPGAIGFIVFLVVCTICLNKRNERQMSEQRQQTGGTFVVRRTGGMVVMAVPEEQAGEMLTHAADTYGEGRNQDSRHPRPQWHYQQTRREPGGDNHELLQANRTLENTDVNTPPSYNEVVNNRKFH